MTYKRCWISLAWAALAACRPTGVLITVGTDAGTDAGDAPVALDRAAPDDGLAIDAAPADDAADARDARDVASDAPADGAVDDGGGGVDEGELTGLASRGVAATADRNGLAVGFRLYYVDDAGDLRVELRDAALARRCDESLGRPPGVTLAGSPSAGFYREHVAIAARATAAGPVEYWVRFAEGRVGSCGTALRAWERAPTPPGGQQWATAPAVGTFSVFGVAPTLWLAGVTSSGEVYATTRLEGEGAAWTPWESLATWPRAQTVRARPSLTGRGANFVDLRVYVREASGATRLYARTRPVGTGAWAPAWSPEALPAAPGAPSARRAHFRDSTLIAAGADGWGLWELFVDARGHVHAAGSVNVNEWFNWDFDWNDLGQPFAPRTDLVPAAIALVAEPLESEWNGALLALAVPRTGPRTLRYARCTYLEWAAGPARWMDAPGPLR